MRSRAKKTFDAVQMMREIRDKLSVQFRGMTFTEQKAHMRERLATRKDGERKTSRDVEAA